MMFADIWITGKSPFCGSVFQYYRLFRPGDIVNDGRGDMLTVVDRFGFLMVNGFAICRADGDYNQAA